MTFLRGDYDLEGNELTNKFALRLGLDRNSFYTVLLGITISAVALSLRVWQLGANYELIDDEAYFANIAAGLFSRTSVFGWEVLWRFDYGMGILGIIGLWEKILSAIGMPLDEKTMHLPQVLLGLLLVWTAYGLVKKLLSKGPALAVAGLVAVMPMHVSQSRTTMHWMLPSWLAILIILLILFWCEKEKGHTALLTGLATAAYIQSDGLQLLILGSLPIIFWILAGEREKINGPYSISLCNLLFVGALAFAAVLMNPVVLQLVSEDQVNRFNPNFIGKLNAYSCVAGIFSFILALLLIWPRAIAFSSRFLWVWEKMTHPCFFIPVSLSFLIVISVAAASWVETGVPRGILGHAFAKKISIFGIYGWTWMRDLLRVCGAPSLILIVLGLILIPWSLRNKPIRLLGPLALITNLPWLFFVHPTYISRDHYQLTSSTVLILLVVCNLWLAAKRFNKESLFAALIVLTSLFTIPYTLAQVTRKPVFGVGPYGHFNFGGLRPLTGAGHAFKYVQKNILAQEKVFTSYNKNVAKFYLERPYGGKYRDRVIALFHYSPVPHDLAADLLKKEGRAAQWYVVSRSFSQKYFHEFDPMMKLRSVAPGDEDSTEVWHRDYQGVVEGLAVQS